MDRLRARVARVGPRFELQVDLAWETSGWTRRDMMGEGPRFPPSDRTQVSEPTLAERVRQCRAS